MNRRAHPSLAPLLSLALGLAAGCAASHVDPDGGGAGGDAGGGAGGSAGAGGGGGSGIGGFVSTCLETFSEPVFVGVDAQAAALGNVPGSAAPFVFDPPSGAVLPAGWSSPTFLVHTPVLPAAASLVVSLGGPYAVVYAAPAPAPKAHADSVVGGAWWTIALPPDVWEATQCLVADGDATAELAWEVRWSTTLGAPPDGAATGTLTLLRDALTPDMTYWEITEDGAHSVQRLYVPSGKRQTLIQSGDCVGCHASAAGDGKDFAVQGFGSGGWAVEVLRPTEENGVVVADPSPVVAPWARELLGASPGPLTRSVMVPTFAASRWSDADGHFLAAVTPEVDPATGSSWGRILVAEVDAQAPSAAISPPIQASGGDAAALHAAVPVLDPSGSRFVLAATDVMVDGYFAPTGWGGSSDLWQLPVTLAKGQKITFGEPAPLPFASGTPENETFPSFSPDGALLAFVRTAPGRGGYDEDTAEVWVMPADGSAPPIRVAANDAPGSADPSAPVFHGLGLTTSWPRFGEQIVEAPDGSTYYSLLVSSRRGPADLWEARNQGSMPINGRPITRLWLAAVRRAPGGALESFPAACVPGQRVDAGAHTASFVSVPGVPPPPPN